MAGIRALRKAERPGEILEAAFEAFVQNGYAATRLEDVAARLGVSKGTIYFYFGSKEALFEAAVQAIGSLPLAAFNAERPDFTDDVAADLHLFLDDLYRFIDANQRSRETLRLLVAEAQRFPRAVDLYFSAFMDPVIERLRARLALAAARGEIRRDLCSIAEAVAAPPFGYMVMTLLFSDHRGIDSRQLSHSQFELLIGGLLPKASDGEPDDAPAAWTPWRPAPDALTRWMLTAPLGPGLYELRLASGDPLLIGSARDVASALTDLLPGRHPEGSGATTPRRIVIDPTEPIEYRTLPCDSLAEAQRSLKSFDRHAYRLGIRATR